MGLKCLFASGFCKVSATCSMQYKIKISSDSLTCTHTQMKIADYTGYLTQSQSIYTWSTSPSIDPVMQCARQGSNQNTSVEVTGMTRHGTSPQINNTVKRIEKKKKTFRTSNVLCNLYSHVGLRILCTKPVLLLPVHAGSQSLNHFLTWSSANAEVCKQEEQNVCVSGLGTEISCKRDRCQHIKALEFGLFEEKTLCKTFLLCFEKIPRRKFWLLTFQGIVQTH